MYLILYPKSSVIFGTHCVQAESKKALKAIPEIEFNKCFDNWKKRWHKCIISGGDYFEVDEIDLDK